jgi:Na+/serine symporter
MKEPTTRIVDVMQNNLICNLTCPTCPALTHTNALGIKAWNCMSGIVTNIQGFVPVKTCPNYVADSVAIDAEKTVTLKCSYGVAP